MRYDKTVAAATFFGLALLPFTSEASWWTKEKLLPCGSKELELLVEEAILDDFARVGVLDRDFNPEKDKGSRYELRESNSPAEIRWLKVAYPNIPPEDKRLCRGSNTIPTVVQTIQPFTGKLIGYVIGYGLGERITTFEYRASDAKKDAPKQTTPATDVAEIPTSKVEGDYDSLGDGLVSLRTFLLDEDKRIFAAKVLTASERGCTGEFSGSGSLKGNVLRLVPTKKEGSDNQCSVTLIFDKTGSRATVQEDKCGDYHGADCAFDGEVAKKR